MKAWELEVGCGRQNMGCLWFQEHTRTDLQKGEQRENKKEKRDRGQLESEALAPPWGSITWADVQQNVLHKVTESRDGDQFWAVAEGMVFEMRVGLNPGSDRYVIWIKVLNHCCKPVSVSHRVTMVQYLDSQNFRKIK